MTDGDHNVHKLVLLRVVDHCHYTDHVMICKLPGCTHEYVGKKDRAEGELRLWGKPESCQECKERMESASAAT